MTNLKLASQEEVDTILKETREWAKQHTMFSSAIGSSALSAAEFTLNRQGKTMYRHRAVEEIQNDLLACSRSCFSTRCDTRHPCSDVDVCTGESLVNEKLY